MLRRSGMQQSMNSAESVYDNAFMESCFGTVKPCAKNVLRTVKTELELVGYASGPEAVRELTSSLRYYNHVRLHSAIGYVTPADKLNGLEQVIFAERDRKLEQARQRRQAARQASQPMTEVAG